MNRSFLLLLILLFTIEGFSQCEGLLEDGLYEITRTTTRADFQQDMKSYFSSETFKQDVRSGKWGGGLTIPYEGVTYSLNASSSDDAFTQFQQKIAQSSSFNLTKNDFASISNQLANKSLYESYVECQRIHSTQTGLVMGKPVETEETVIFPFYFRPGGSSDKNPVVDQFIVTPPDALINDGGIKAGKKITSFKMAVICKRDKINEVRFFLQSKGHGFITATSAPTASSKFESPLGTIIASFLTFEQLRESIGEEGVWKITNKWSPCDGRNVIGSAFQKISQSPTVPDLRGQFLRGLNSFDMNPPATVTPRISAIDPDGIRTVGKPQTDAFQGHFHRFGGNLSTQDKPNKQPVIVGGGDKVEGDAPNQSSLDKFKYVKNPTEDGVNGAPRISTETRPKNIAIYYYIKIN